MDAIRSILRTLRCNSSGATAIEYGLIAGLIVVAMVGGVAALGTGLNGMWTNISTEFSKY